MSFDDKGNNLYFVLRGERFNRLSDTTHDASGVMIYKALNQKGTGYFSGGLTVGDLLQLEAGSRLKVSMPRPGFLVLDCGRLIH